MPGLSEQQQALLARCASVDLLIADLNGILRAKRIRAAAFEGLMRAGGLRMPGSMFSMDSNGAIVSGTGIVAEEGERDRFCPIIPGTLQPVPWTSDEEPPRAQALLRMLDEGGEPFFADPLAALERVEAKLQARGLIPVVAAELEFYLFERGDPAAASVARSSLGAANQVYAAARLEERSAFLEAVHDACARQGIATGATVAEASEGHFEINLQHQRGATRAAVEATLFKRVVREIARCHGYVASFMAKPAADISGSGLHFHVSLVDGEDAPIFVADPEVNDPLRHAVGGLCDTMPEAMVLFAPNANSYRRYRAGSFVPMTPGWGRNNRTTAVRIPPGPARVEHRVAGADANPSLVLAAILAGMHHGIAAQREPPAEIRDDAAGHGGRPLASTWERALAAAADAEVLPAELGERLWQLLLRVKTAERARFERHVTPLERAWYLGTF